MNSLTQLADASLHSETKRLAGSSNTLSAQLLAHLAEVEARGIHRERACASLYTYCVYELRMSEDEAQRRCRAARLARQFPILLEMLAEASLHLTGILLLGPHLTHENCAELLARARFRTKREIERLVAEVAPCPDVPSKIVPLHRAGAAEEMLSPFGDGSAGLYAFPRNTWATYVRALAGEVRELQAGLGAGQAPPRASNEEAAFATSGQESSSAAQGGETGARTPARDENREVRRDENREVRHDEHRDVSTPISSGEAEPTAAAPPVAELRYKVQFTADQAYVDLLEEACNLLHHELRGRDLVAVQCRALELLVRKLRQRKYAARERPCPKAPEPTNATSQPQPEPERTPARPPAPQSVTRARRCATQSATSVRPPAPQSAATARHSAPKSATGDRQSARHTATPSTNQSRYIPAEIRRDIWQRDKARCAYVDARGQRCREQSGLEFHHQHPHGRGGPATVDNLALHCRSHNTLAAEQDFGRDVILEKRARRERLVEPGRAGAGP